MEPPRPAGSSPASTGPRETLPAGTRGGDAEEEITFTYRLDDRAWRDRRRGREGRGRRRQDAGPGGAELGRSTRPGITAPILGVRNLDQLDDNLAALGWELDEEHRNALFWASAFPRGYPYDFIEYANH